MTTVIRKIPVVRGLAVAVVAAIGLASGLSASAQDKVLLVRKAKVGDVSRHGMEGSMTVDANGTQLTLQLQGTEKITISAVATDGPITMQGLTEQMSVTINGQALPAPPADTSTVVVRPDGSLVSMKSTSADNGTEVRLFSATTPVFSDKPVGVGDTWTRDIKADTASGQPAAHAEYKLVAFEKVGAIDTAKISMSYAESGTGALSSTVTAWVDRATGEQVKVEGDVQNFPLPGMGGGRLILKQWKL